ncbi:MAG TPA: DUF302 domain-containing protein [Candidatus Binataceae bacterium]|nr:DUF302 domain-containing protein [Candidatus Binataceae bacterium]
MDLQESGLIKIASPRTFAETLGRIEAALKAAGLTIFAIVDHSGAAQKIGLKMPPTQVIIFGSPKAGTPLMVASPTIAIDLPLKALVAEDESGKVWVTYNDPNYLKQRHQTPDHLIANLAGAGALLQKAIG